jgi:hypothetical protein
MSRSIVMHRTGTPDVLTVEERPLLPLASIEVQVGPLGDYTADTTSVFTVVGSL